MHHEEKTITEKETPKVEDVSKPELKPKPETTEKSRPELQEQLENIPGLSEQEDEDEEPREGE